MKKLFYIFLLSLLGLFTGYAQTSEWIAPASANAIKNPITANDQALKEGKKLYKINCAVCHGDFGKGDGVAGVALDPKPANFTSKEFKSQTSGAIYWKITTGRPPMMNYTGIIEEKDIWRIITYIQSLE